MRWSGSSIRIWEHGRRASALRLYAFERIPQKFVRGDNQISFNNRSPSNDCLNVTCGVVDMFFHAAKHYPCPFPISLFFPKAKNRVTDSLFPCITAVSCRSSYRAFTAANSLSSFPSLNGAILSSTGLGALSIMRRYWTVKLPFSRISRMMFSLENRSKNPA